MPVHVRPEVSTGIPLLRRGVWRAALTTVIVASAGLSACSSGGAPGEVLSGGASAQVAEAIPGVQPCSRLVGLVESTDTGERLASLESRTLPCLSPGPSIDLASLGSKPVVVNLWASWCGPCREEMPLLQGVADAYGSEVAFVGVVTRDDADTAAAFLELVGVSYPQLSDRDGALLRELRSPGLPVTVVLRPDGSVLEKHIGPFEDKSELAELLDTSLQ